MLKVLTTTCVDTELALFVFCLKSKNRNNHHCFEMPE